MESDDRPRGILSPADRAYLRGERTYASAQAERNARGRIRERVEHALLDFELLVGLDDHDRELVFEKRLSERDGPAAFDGLVAALAFLYDGVGDTDLNFSTVVREGINLAEADRGRAAAVDLDVTYRALDTDTLLRELDAGQDLSLTEIAFLHASDDVSPDELARYFEGEDEIADGRIQSKMTEF